MSEITNPQDAELEEVVLGACLLESKAITLVAGILRPGKFFFYGHDINYLPGMVHTLQGSINLTVRFSVKYFRP